MATATRLWTERACGFESRPDNYELTLKVWYVCDENLNRSNPRPRVRITAANEEHRINEIAQWITDEIGIRADKMTQGRMAFDTRNTQRFFEYVGDPLPGFEYKWPSDN